jgi:hypothetical protein
MMLKLYFLPYRSRTASTSSINNSKMMILFLLVLASLPRTSKNFYYCLSSTGFMYDNRHHTATDSGPIGLSIMVPIAEIWMAHTVRSAIVLAQEKNFAIPRNVNVYMDDSFNIIRQNATKTAHLDFMSRRRPPSPSFYV